MFTSPIYIIYPEDKGSKFLRNFGIFQLNYTASRARRNFTPAAVGTSNIE
jgi:hypothetical protein